LEFAADEVRVFGSEVVIGGAVFVGSLDNNSLCTKIIENNIDMIISEGQT
jgi:hypothetical protein